MPKASKVVEPFIIAHGDGLALYDAGGRDGFRFEEVAALFKLDVEALAYKLNIFPRKFFDPDDVFTVQTPDGPVRFFTYDGLCLAVVAVADDVDLPYPVLLSKVTQFYGFYLQSGRYRKPVVF